MSQEKTRGRSFAVARHFNYDTHPQNPNYAGMSQTDWVAMIREMLENAAKSDDVEFLAYIFHDKDMDKDGGLKPIHAHAFVRFKCSMDQQDVAAMFGTTDRLQNCQPANNNLGAAKYMIHISDSALRDEKHIYSPDDVVCFDCRYRDLIKDSFWGKAKNEEDENKLLDKKEVERLVVDLALKVRNGELRKTEGIALLEEKAGYYWVRQYRNSFDDDQKAFLNNTVESMTKKGRKNNNIYIMGAGGIGKSNLGRKLGARLAGNKGLYVSAPLGKNKTPDALNHYTDEAVAIFNEMSPQGWSLDEFLGCFDMYEYAPFPSRNENKHFIGHTSIFTNSITPLRFAKDLLIYSKGGSKFQDPANKSEINSDRDTLDKYWQARRRFSSMILLLKDATNRELVHGHVFNLRYDKVLDDGAHELVGSFSFKNEIGKEPEITDAILDKVMELLAIDANSLTDLKSIETFLDENGLNEPLRDDLLSDFIENVVSECSWELLPTQFLYALYRRYRDMFYPTNDMLTIKEFLNSMKVLLDGWEWKDRVRTGDKMSADEPLISEYNLVDWMNKEYGGSNPVMKRNFKRKERYAGFIRK